MSANQPFNQSYSHMSSPKVRHLQPQMSTISANTSVQCQMLFDAISLSCSLGICMPSTDSQVQSDSSDRGYQSIRLLQSVLWDECCKTPWLVAVPSYWCPGINLSV